MKRSILGFWCFEDVRRAPGIERLRGSLSAGGRLGCRIVELSEAASVAESVRATAEGDAAAPGTTTTPASRPTFGAAPVEC